MFFFNETAATEIYNLSLHDALPILIEMRIGKEYDELSEEVRGFLTSKWHPGGDEDRYPSKEEAGQFRDGATAKGYLRRSIPNQYGGRENLEAISFLKQFNEQVHLQYPGTLTVAEE